MRLNFTPKYRKPKSCQNFAFPAICVQLLKVFVTRKLKTLKNEPTGNAVCYFKERIAVFWSKS